MVGYYPTLLAGSEAECFHRDNYTSLTNDLHSVMMMDGKTCSPEGARLLALGVIMVQRFSAAPQSRQRSSGQGIALSNKIGNFRGRKRQQNPVLGIIARFPIDRLREYLYKPLRAARTYADHDMAVGIIDEVGFTHERTPRFLRRIGGRGPAALASEILHPSSSICNLPSVIFQSASKDHWSAKLIRVQKGVEFIRPASVDRGAGPHHSTYCPNPISRARVAATVPATASCTARPTDLKSVICSGLCRPGMLPASAVPISPAI